MPAAFMCQSSPCFFVQAQTRRSTSGQLAPRMRAQSWGRPALTTLALTSSAPGLEHQRQHLRAPLSPAAAPQSRRPQAQLSCLTSACPTSLPRLRSQGTLTRPAQSSPCRHAQAHHILQL